MWVDGDGGVDERGVSDTRQLLADTPHVKLIFF